MRKFIIVKILALLLILSSFTLFGCEKKSPLLPFVSEYRSNIFEGKSDNFELKAYYGYKETPYLNDAKVENYYHELTFILKGNILENASYSLEVCDNNETIPFERSNNGLIKARYRVKDFTKESFKVNIISSSSREEITLKTILPKNTLLLNSILLSLEKKEAVLINSYYVNAEFNAEIHARVLVKNEKPYWYIAFLNGKTLKAFLVDGISGEVLAIREVI